LLPTCVLCHVNRSTALDPAVAGEARKGDFVRALDHFKLLQGPIN
jgi:hypothetical protein